VLWPPLPRFLHHACTWTKRRSETPPNMTQTSEKGNGMDEMNR
jgi:hypothetical protein